MIAGQNSSTARRLMGGALLVVLAGLAGCGAPTVASGVPGAAQIDLLTVMSSDKTIVDHVVSWSSGKDCSTVNVEKGNHYCKEDEVVIKPKVHCYSTLGRTTCYEQPDPYANGQRELGNNDHNLKDTTRAARR